MNLPRHPKARQFLVSGLFFDVQCFSQLEQRIAGLPTESEKGAAFEVFTEACLATQRIYQATHVWPGNSIPSAVRQKLRLPLNDMGIDGVIVTSTDETISYQSKFRTGRPSLAWRELSTFYGLADCSEQKLVFTNCDRVAKVAEERMGAIFVRGNDLDRLTPEDFSIIERWLAEKPATIKRKTPRSHQVLALHDIVSGLTRGPRATALMACGSGKTLVALWAAEKLGARTILILLPSLALVRQVLHEWIRETGWQNVQFLCVCSDATVYRAEDSLIVRPSELDFAVTTESSKVRRFLAHKTDAVRLVFSTYHSSHVIAEAIKGLPPFDFGVFDEAHKTAGRDGLKFSTALKDENIPITRRLFLTATPRHYDVAKKDKFGESKIVFSMDAPDIYGPVVHRLSFSKAAKAGIITDYKVIISVVTSEMVTDEVLRCGIVLVKGDEVKARHVANQIALKSAIEKYGVSKVFTFHSKVASAKSFTADGSEGIETHLDGFSATHIEGAMSTAYRDRLLRDFASAPKAILSNARCLTEGVDVPAVDMVAFLSPKRSLVDIVQATGRAMRLSPDTKKEFGYVLVPLYVEKSRGETIEQAVMRSNFDEVWKILQGLKEQDEMLAQVIAEMRIEKGRTGGYDDTRFRERVDVIGPEISLEILRKTISAACIEMVGDTWFERYGQLSAYRDSHGDCDIPARYSINKTLATWAVDQRVRFRDGVLDPDKIELLNRLGFKWEPRASSWRAKLLELVDYKRRFGNCLVPLHWSENPQLAQWVRSQRFNFSRLDISQDRVEQLNKIDFEWTAGPETWDLRFSELCDFREKFGHTRVKAKYLENPALGQWVTSQRYDRRQNNLDQVRIERLDSIGFVWDGRIARSCKKAISGSLEQKWNEMFERFKAYGEGRVKVVDDETKRLNQWVLSQRAQRKKGKLSENRISLLTGAGFMWRYSARRLSDDTSLATVDSELMKRTWDDIYEELVDFYKIHGHPNVSADWTAQPLLARWVSNQRIAKRKNRLTSLQVDQLNTIAFAWTAYEGDWELMFQKLSDYLRRERSRKRRELLPSVELSRWMLTQRQLRKRGDLISDREQRLNSVDFKWEPFSERWTEMYSRLQSYWEKNGDCRVPSKWPEDTKLANWVQTQRAKKSQDKLSKDRVLKLEKLEFEWSPGSSFPRSPRNTWDELLLELLEYKRQYGDYLVPQRWRQNPRLADWVSGLRTANNHGELETDTFDSLSEIGFDWDPLGTHWEELFDQLLKFKKLHGHTNVSQKVPEYRKLGSWVKNQRRAKVKNSQSFVERAERLEAIGFQWRLKTSNTWGKMFDKLLKFREIHGHCNVPQTWKEDKALGRWVNRQRTEYGSGDICDVDRIRRLEEVGFEWNTLKNKK